MAVTTGDDADSREALRLFLLGGFRVVVGDQRVDDTHWRRRKARQLIAMIALAPGHAIHREHALDLLWPDSDPASAANSLYQTLHLARRALDSARPAAGERLQLRSEMLSFQTDDIPLWLDVKEFEAAAGQARHSKDRLTFQRAIELYAGDLLPQDRYDDWVSGRRESLRTTYLALLLDSATQARSAGELEPAIASLQHLVVADPLHEEGHRLLMQCLAESGERQAALRQYDLLRRALQRDLDAEPDTASRNLHQQIASGAIPVAPMASRRVEAPAQPPRATNIPVQSTSFVGRERDIAEIHRLLTSTRLLTLTGPGGAGKTRLALESVAGLAAGTPDGIWLVDLSSLTDPALVPQAVASVLGISEVPDRPVLESITRNMAHRRLVLLLDNCEHLIDACAVFVTRVLQETDAVRLLATSREPLRVPGEVTWPVPSLTLPDQRAGVAPGDILASESARLFVDRAKAVQPGLTVADDDASAIAHICHRLDGIPLAIELAAARGRVLSVSQIAQRLDDRFRLLTAGSRTAPSRQQTLKGAIGWSHALLDEQERALFRRLCVFAGGFDLEAAEEVCAGGDLDVADVLDVLARLVDKSLVAAEAARPETRYRLLESIREYAADRLAESGEATSISRRHAAVFLQVAGKIEPSLRTWQQDALLARLQLEHDNLRAAIDWYQQQGHIEEELGLIGALAWFWHLSGYFSEGRARLVSVLERSGETPSAARLKVLIGAGMVTVIQGELGDGRRWLEDAELLAGSLDDRHGFAIAHLWLVWPALFTEGPAAAAPRAATSLAAFRSLDDPWHLALALLASGFVTTELGALGIARERFNEAASLFRDLGDRWGIVTSLTELARVAYREHDPAARTLVEEAVAVSRSMSGHWQTVQALGLLVEIARFEGDFKRARKLGEETVELSTEVGVHINAAWAQRDLGHVALAEGDVEAANRYFTASLDMFQERSYKLGIASTLVGLAVLAARESRATPAAQLLGAAHRLLQETSTVLAPADHAAAEGATAAARAILGEAAFDDAFARGKTMGIDELCPRL